MRIHVEIDIPIPRWARYAAIVLAPLGVIVATTAIVRANVPNKFATGDVLDATKMNANFDALDKRLAAGNAVVSATVTPVSGSAGCGIVQDGAWIAGAVHQSLGTCAIVITSNFFTAAPNCVATNNWFVSPIKNLTASGFTVEVDGTNGAVAGDDHPISIICVGPVN
jgi:hypothetical protein